MSETSQVGDATISVLLVDSHDVVRVGVRSVLLAETDIEVVGEARTAAEARPLIATLRPDVLVLDAHLPDSSGVALCREALTMTPEIRCLVLATDADDQVMSQAIMAGAAGYVLKQIEAASLVSGVRLVASGHTLFDPEAAAKVVHNVEARRRMHEVVADLTPQQRRILVLLAEGISNRQIAERLVLAEKTVKNHITGLLAKLGVSHRTQAALMASQLLEDGVVPRPTSPADDARQARPGSGPKPPRPRGPAASRPPERSR
ncbi:LuxR family two component transcriptional regulator [Nocardioides albertanoniae]|uniref:LuxR family two component transcriptional regulator n=1 Tax=Nocardioides albertanoniae TaxID=1175486 RepID=A0A543AD46_9ACTN|nr:response regulator transcription factor [Nocardioides albertanoniae]TQL70460.1 LuxR family two component transcriptional regulator [Nocardioides albertanoniae]